MLYKSRFEIVCNRQRHSYHEINIDCDDTAVDTFYFIIGNIVNNLSCFDDFLTTVGQFHFQITRK